MTKILFRKKSLIFLSSLMILLVVSFGLFYLMLAESIFSDFPAHIDIWKFYTERGKIPFPPLYYLSFYALSLLVPGEKSLEIGVLFLMVLSICVKYWLSFRYLFSQREARSYFAWIPLALMFVFPVFLFGWEGSNLYLGKFSSSVWHNGSSILVFPICLLLFLSTLKWMDNGEISQLKRILVVSILILLIKPNYLFCFIPAFPIFMMFRKSPRQALLMSFGVSFFLFLLVMGSKYLIFDHDSEQSIFYNFHSKGQVVLRPFAVWNYFAESPVPDMISSLLFLITSILLFWKSLIKVPEFVFSMLILGFAILIYLLFAESGPGFIDGNFFWQIPIALFIVFLTVIKNLILLYKSNSNKEVGLLLKLTVCLLAFSSHVVSGIFYLIHFISTGSYF